MRMRSELRLWMLGSIASRPWPGAAGERLRSDVGTQIGKARTDCSASGSDPHRLRGTEIRRGLSCRFEHRRKSHCRIEVSRDDSSCPHKATVDPTATDWNEARISAQFRLAISERWNHANHSRTALITPPCLSANCTNHRYHRCDTRRDRWDLDCGQRIQTSAVE